MPRVTRTIAAAISVFVLVIAYAVTGTARAAGPVAGSIHQVYHPGAPGVPSTAITDYSGPMVELQNSDVGYTAAEPTLGVAPDGTAYFAASSIVVDDSRAWGGAATHTLRSTDGGLTWQNVQFHVPETPVEILPVNADPYVYVDPQTGRVFNIDLYAACSWLNYSDDKGETWSQSPAACGVPVDDHQTMVAAKPIAGVTTFGYPNVLYYCVNQVARTACGRSTDGGLVWLPTDNDPYSIDQNRGQCSSLMGHLAADPDGRIFLPAGTCGKPWLSISSDAGATWSRVQVSTIPATTTHTSVAADAAGNLYYIWFGKAPNESLELPYLAISRDHGKTWGAPMMVAPPGVKNVNFPVIDAGDEGRIAINFPGTTYGTQTSKKAEWNQYILVSTNALDESPVFVSATGNDEDNFVHRGECRGRCGGMWDFIDIHISSVGEVWAAASDDCFAKCDAGTLESAHDGEGLVIRQIGGPKLRG